MSIRALHRGIGGLIINGTTRDKSQVCALGFPVFHLGTNPFPATKKKPGRLATSIQLRGIEISPGDLMVGDADGVLIVPGPGAEVALQQARDLADKEAQIAALLRGGGSLVTVLGLAPLPL